MHAQKWYAPNWYAETEYTRVMLGVGDEKQSNVYHKGTLRKDVNLFFTFDYLQRKKQNSIWNGKNKRDSIYTRGTLRSIRILLLAKIPTFLSWLAEILELRKGLIIWVA